MIARVAIGAALMLGAAGSLERSHNRAQHPTRCWGDGISSYSAAHRRRRRGSRWNGPARPRWSDNS